MLYKMRESELKPFVLAGQAIFTIEDPVEGVRFTYQVHRHKEDKVWFVRLFKGPNNIADYDYLCYFKENLKVKVSKKSPMPIDSLPVATFNYFMKNIDAPSLWLNIYHSGKCGRCGRRLTVPESIMTGLGPECAKYRY